MCDIHYEKLLPPLMSGQTLIDSLSNYPEYDESIRTAEQYERLGALADIYRVYYPFSMVIEIYNKLKRGMKSYRSRKSWNSDCQGYVEIW